jgi:hypothetical protein
MILSHEDDDDTHPYWYAKIIEIFHAFVRHPDHPEPISMNFLWVRWYGRNIKHRSGWKAKHLPLVGFIGGDATLPFGFLDPIDVIRGCHLIPAFHHGRTDELLPPSVARLPADNDEEWLYYYVNMYVLSSSAASESHTHSILIWNRFVDRDMLMRYRGGGVGHKSTRAATDTFLKDRDRKDNPDYVADANNSEDELEESDIEDNDSDPSENVEKAEDNLMEETGTDDNIGFDPEGMDRSTEDDEGDDDAVFEEEFDYGYNLNYEGDASEEEGQDVEGDDVLGWVRRVQ